MERETWKQRRVVGRKENRIEMGTERAGGWGLGPLQRLVSQNENACGLSFRG